MHTPVSTPQDPPQGIPPAEVVITEDLVRELLRSQHPDLNNLELALLGSGWDNTTFRLGAELAVRLPRRKLGADLIRKEQRWLPGFAEHLPLPIPTPTRIGVSGSGYPWPWSIVPWIEGTSATEQPPRPSEAANLGRFLRALHRPSPADAPRNEYRGVPLAARAKAVEAGLARMNPGDMAVTVDEVAGAWARTKTIPIDSAEVWLHGDLHSRNVIVADGRVAGVIDWGDMCVGDPATDLAAAWMLFPTRAHRELRDAYGSISELTWGRARGWAVFFGVVLADSGAGQDDAWASIGRRILERACSCVPG
ncbi:MAG: aminoglycoside phosphotransferase family protein [Pseudomonadota bacterium]